MKLSCCTLASKWIYWRLSNPITGPVSTGWCIIIHTITGSAEYSIINFCPFCCKKIEHISH